MSPPGMELLHTPRIKLKSTLSLAILFSASPDVRELGLAMCFPMFEW